eukprot:1061287-Lingulodinium_polyedra.AAC.1
MMQTAVRAPAFWADRVFIRLLNVVRRPPHRGSQRARLQWHLPLTVPCPFLAGGLHKDKQPPN